MLLPSFLPLTLVFICCSFTGILRYKVWGFLRFFFFSFRYLLLWPSLLKLLLMHSTKFGVLYFGFHLSDGVFVITLLISLFIHWLFSSMLFILYIFVDFPVFSLLFLVSYHCSQKRCLIGLQFSRSVVSGSLWPHDCSMPGFPVHHQLPELAQTHVHRVSNVIFFLQLGLNSVTPLPPWPGMTKRGGFHGVLCCLLRLP